MGSPDAYAATSALVLPIACPAQNREPAMAKPPPKTSTTTQQAAEAKKREGQTGTSNVNAARQLQQLEREEKRSQHQKTTK
jgi:uncharacterized low-complexity protein